MQNPFAPVLLVVAMLLSWGAAADWLNPPAGGEGASRPAAPQPAARPRPAHPVSLGAADASALQQRGSEFIKTYWDIVSDNAPHVLDYLKASYAPVVEYYGKPMRKEAILAEKARFLQRWPERRSWRSDAAAAPQVDCDAARSECVISGSRDFENLSAARDARASGRFSYTYRVRFGGGSAQIVGEDSRVIARR